MHHRSHRVTARLMVCAGLTLAIASLSACQRVGNAWDSFWTSGSAEDDQQFLQMLQLAGPAMGFDNRDMALLAVSNQLIGYAVRDYEKRTIREEERAVASRRGQEAAGEADAEIAAEASRNGIFLMVPIAERDNADGSTSVLYSRHDPESGELAGDDVYEVDKEEAEVAAAEQKESGQLTSLGEHTVIMLPPEDDTA